MDEAPKEHWSEEQAADLVDALREVDSYPYGGGVDYALDRESAINLVSTVLIATSMRKQMRREVVTKHFHVAGTTVGRHIDECATCGRDLRHPIHDTKIT